MSDITSPWEDAIPITEYTGRDFVGRNGALSAYDDTGFVQGAADAVQAALELENRSQAVDRVLRYYVAALLDETANMDQRESVETAKQLPPVGWVDANDVRREITVEYGDTEPLHIYTHDAVVELVKWCIDHCTDYESQSEFIDGALRWFVGDEELATHLQR